MQLELLGNHGRAGAALPTMQLCRDLELGIADRGQVHLFGKGSKARTVRVSSDTLELIQTLGRGKADSYVFPSPRGEGHLT